MNRIFFFLILSLFFSSCSMIGLNLHRTAPKHAGKYPSFKQKDSLVGFLYPDRSNYRPYFYDISVDFDIQRKRISGISSMYFEAVEDLDSIQMNLHPNMKISRMEFQHNGFIANFGSPEKNLPIRRKYNALWVHLPQTIKKGEKCILIFRYEGNPEIARRPPWEGGFVWKTDQMKRPWVGVACEKVGAALWWPLKDHLSSEPDSMKMHFTVPTGLTVVSNGVLQSQDTLHNKTSFHYKVSYPINTYNLTFYIGHFEHFSLTYNKVEKKRLHFYVLDYNLEKARLHFTQSKKIIEVYEKLYGEYPFWKDQYKLVESPFAGMEHQTAIAYGNGYRNNQYGLDYIILHETAHEWWGNAISVKDFADIWIHEGIATYSEALFLEETMGYDIYQDYLYFYSLTIKNKKPMVGPREVNYWNYKDGDPYTKGALMMHSLRTTLSDDSLFFSILRTFYQQYRYQTVCSEDFIRWVNEKTGKDYAWFFKQFLFNRKPPKLVYHISLNEKTKEQKMYYQWKDVDEDFVMPILIEDADGTRLRIFPTTREKVITQTGSHMLKPDLKSAYFTAKKIKK